MKSVIVLGAGSWGTALAAMLAERGLHVQLWGRDEMLMREMKETRMNLRYLPSLKLPGEIIVTHRMEELRTADLAVFVIPSKGLRSVAGELKKAGVFGGGEVLLSCTKGIELETGEQMSEIIGEIFHEHSLAALSGPNHAEEIAQRLPSAAVVASANTEVAVQLQSVFTLPWFRCYTSDDITGVEWAGAMKNPYAIAAGIARGLNLGDNAIAALVTRALAEMVRFGVKQGGRVETFYGLSGVGDLVATCYSEHSRNNRVGKLLGQGKSLTDIITSTRMVAEGVPNTESLWRCARKIEASTPLLDEIYAMLYQGKSPKEALRELLGRDPRPEAD